MASKTKDELLGSIEAEQSMMQKFIEENKWHCQRADVLMSSAGHKPKSPKTDDETKDA